MIDKTKSQPLTPTAKQPPAPKPEAPKTAPIAEAKPRIARDTAEIKSLAQPEVNPLDAKQSTGRQVADAASTATAVAEVAKDSRNIATMASTVGGRVSILSRLGTGASNLLTRVADWGDDVARVAPKLARGFAGVAKAAPIVGLVMAGLDIGRAALEKDPEKKREAKGTAALSTVSGVAGIAGAAMLVTPLAPLGVALIGVGIAASVFSVVDTTFFKGKASKVIGDGVDAVGRGISNAASAVASGAKTAWNAITSL